MTAAAESGIDQMACDCIRSTIQIAIRRHVGATDDRRRIAASGNVLLDDPMYGDAFHVFPTLAPPMASYSLPVNLSKVRATTG